MSEFNLYFEKLVFFDAGKKGISINTKLKLSDKETIFQSKPDKAESNILTWDEYREIFPDEEHAIANLPLLYREFAESKYLESLGY